MVIPGDNRHSPDCDSLKSIEGYPPRRCNCVELMRKPRMTEAEKGEVLQATRKEYLRSHQERISSKPPGKNIFEPTSDPRPWRKKIPGLLSIERLCPLPTFELPLDTEERQKIYLKGDKLHETYKAIYKEATGTPYQRQRHTWAMIYLRALEL